LRIFQPDRNRLKNPHGSKQRFWRYAKNRHEREADEAPPLGIILCTGKKAEQIELLELDKSGIHVAEYLTTLSPRAVLAERLQQAARRAQLVLQHRSASDF
jgi:hypothetical protein